MQRPFRGPARVRAAAPAYQIRAFRAPDLPVAADLAAAAFEIDIGERSRADRWRRRVAHPLSTDPDGAFVAELDGSVIGVVQALRRERLWSLSLLAVAPRAQSGGAGRLLLERALAYGAGTDTGLIASSSDPRALRLYALAGFSLLPTFEATGTIDGKAWPRSGAEVRAGGPADLEALAAISRDIRGAPHTAELEFALGLGARLVRLGDRGFAVATPGRGVWLLVARDEEAAAALLWSALALAEAERPSIGWITAGQQWAIEVVLGAGLQLIPNGALCVLGEPGPLRPFLPSGPFA
jgi:ribosomal protein S18 acetylase RimI-like enzyme